MQAIPSILAGRDVIGLAATGSGKTLSYLLPWVISLPPNNLAVQPRAEPSTTISPLALIVVPTRELMDQVFHELRGFCGEHSQSTDASSSFVAVGSHFTVAAVCGGVSLSMQTRQLQCTPTAARIIVVATPGRLLHLMDQRVVSLDAVEYVVLDEVDRMLDAEMEPQLRSILQSSNERGRQTLLWSATMPTFLERLARSAVLDPITIRVGMGSQRTGRTSLHVTQHVVFMRFAEKRQRLLQVLRTIPTPPVIVFCNSHDTVDFVTRVLRLEQFHVAGLHGDKSQAFRFQVMAAFREGYVDVLVATDLASRGLDFTDVDHIIQFDLPHTIEDYVHRCGRTGRRDGKPGKVTAFLTEDCTIASDLQRLLKEAKQELPRELETLSRFQPA
jgi:ATP-dependent RNA helicase DDX41